MLPKRKVVGKTGTSKKGPAHTPKFASSVVAKSKSSNPSWKSTGKRFAAISKALEKMKSTKKKSSTSSGRKAKSHKLSFKKIVVSKVVRPQHSAYGAPKESPSLNDLPFSYNETKLVLLARDPFWAYAYWDFSGETWNWIQDMRHKKNGLRYVLRLKNCDDHKFFDVDVQLETKNWYIHIGIPDASFEAELGIIDGNGQYYLIVKSNRIRMPRNGPSDEIDAKWHPEFFDEIYQLSGGGKRGQSSDLFSHFKKRSS